MTDDTDARLISRTTLPDELTRADPGLGFGWPDICTLLLDPFESACLPVAERRVLLRQLAAELDGASAGTA